MATIVSTPGASNANSYEEVAEADTYFETRLALVPPWDGTDPDVKISLLIMGTRSLDAMFRGQKTLVLPQGSRGPYYIVRRMWTGIPASTTQKLAWPRSGMYDANGNAIAVNVIPADLKDALSEFAGQLQAADRTLDNDISVQGITSARAGSVAVTFKGEFIDAKVLPDAVINLIPPSWYTEEQYEPAQPSVFEVMDVR